MGEGWAEGERDRGFGVWRIIFGLLAVVIVGWVEVGVETYIKGMACHIVINAFILNGLHEECSFFILFSLDRLGIQLKKA